MKNQKQIAGGVNCFANWKNEMLPPSRDFILVSVLKTTSSSEKIRSEKSTNGDDQYSVAWPPKKSSGNHRAMMDFLLHA